MLGAIIGDIVGSRFEFNNTHSKDFEFFHKDCRVTDDSAMTAAVMATILESNLSVEHQYKVNLIQNFKEFYEMIPDGDYGLKFTDWLESEDPQPYYSFGNGACMRVSPCAFTGLRCSDVTCWTTEVSHNHPLALKWAELYTRTIEYIMNSAMSVRDSKNYLRQMYEATQGKMARMYYLNSWKEDVKPGEFDETVFGTVPLAFEAVYTADDFEDAIRNAVAMGGDSDTIACMAGALAEVVFGIPMSIQRRAFAKMPVAVRHIVREFYSTFAHHPR